MKKLNKNKVNYWIDFVMLLTFIGSAVSGLILWGGFSRGFHRGQTIFLGMVKHQWKQFHLVLGFILLIVVFIHILLHSKWIIKMTKNIFKKAKNKNI